MTEYRGASRWWIAILGFVGLVVVGVLLKDNGSTTEPLGQALEVVLSELSPEPETAVGIPVESTPEAIDFESRESASPSNATPPAGSSRETIELAAFSGILVDENGGGLEGVQLSWTWFSNDLVEQSKWQDIGPWLYGDEWFEANTTWAVSGMNGSFEFPDAPDMDADSPSVVWATQPGTAAKAILLEADPVDWPQGESYVMESAQALDVHVVDVAGRGLEGALVHLIALVDNSRQPLEPLDGAELARVFLRRNAPSPVGGRLLLPNLGGTHQVHASLDDQVSSAWTGEYVEPIQLVLHPSFTASGRILLKGGGQVTEPELSVEIDSWRAGQFQSVARPGVESASLEWGPIRIPLTAAERFSFRLRTKHVVPRTRFIDAPSPGEHVFIEMDSELGHELWFALAEGGDTSGAFLKDGSMELLWDGMDPHCTYSRRVRSDGYIRFVACPPGPIKTIRGSAAGYVTRSAPGPRVPETDPTVHILDLAVAGSVRGRCLANGEPVSDFDITLWATETSEEQFTRSFAGSADGQFELDEAPLGECQLVASSKTWGPSQSRVVLVRKGEVTEVELQLQNPLAGRGFVQDESGEPLPQATVQAFLHDGRKLIANRGAPIRVGPDGGFVLEALAPGRNAIRIQAPGFTSVTRWEDGDAGTPVSFGTIQLQPLLNLEVRLRFPGSFDPALCQVSIEDPPGQWHPYRPLSSSGVALFEGIPSTTRSVSVLLPDGTGLSRKLPRPRGRDWVVEFEVGGSGAIEVELDLGSYEGDLPSSASLRVDSYSRGTNALVRGMNLPKNGHALIKEVPPGTYIVKVAQDVRVLGSALVRVAEASTAKVHLRFDGEDSVFRIVDGQGRPIPGAALSLYSPTYPLWRRAVSDSNGICTVEGASRMEAFAGIQHSELGEAWEIPVQLAQGSAQVTELELKADHSLRLRVLDGETPVSGVECRPCAVSNRNVDVAHARKTDTNGLVQFDKLSAGTYGVDLSSPEIWTRDIEVTVGPGGSPETVQVRRLGGAQFQVETASSQPLSGAAVSLTSIEFGEPLTSWVHNRLIDANPASLLTNESGVLDLSGLPRGSYKWRVTSAQGWTQEGELIISPGELSLVHVEAP